MDRWPDWALFSDLLWPGGPIWPVSLGNMEGFRRLTNVLCNNFFNKKVNKRMFYSTNNSCDKQASYVIKYKNEVNSNNSCN